jgi:DNA polymerase-3 subunit epsilon
MKITDLITASIDTETTGLNVATDRIITLAIHKCWPNGAVNSNEWRMNPGIPIPAASSKVHGITDDQVKDLPCFGFFARDILEWLRGVQVYVGFNIYGFDAQIISEEFNRYDICHDWPPSDMPIIDAGTIFKKKEARTLGAAVLKYVGKKHEGAHGALADAEATLCVLQGQLAAYSDLAEMDVKDLAKFSQNDGMIDFAGKLKMVDGYPVYNFGKSKGLRVCDDPGFANWMLGKDFSSDTKKHVRRILDDIDRIDRQIADAAAQPKTTHESGCDVPF